MDWPSGVRVRARPPCVNVLKNENIVEFHNLIIEIFELKAIIVIVQLGLYCVKIDTIDTKRLFEHKCDGNAAKQAYQL